MRLIIRLTLKFLFKPANGQEKSMAEWVGHCYLVASNISEKFE
jgi:hypothetical protein